MSTQYSSTFSVNRKSVFLNAEIPPRSKILKLIPAALTLLRPEGNCLLQSAFKSPINRSN